MKTIHNRFTKLSHLTWSCALALLMQWGHIDPAYAQQGGQGNTTIFGGAQMSFFSNYNFATGGGGAQPGVILTERASGNFGILNFIGSNLAATGASDQGYVDGYVRKYGTGQFVFPVGDNGNLGPFAASGDGTLGAYFHANATTAVTSNLFTGTDYPALPSGGPFPTTSMGAGVNAVSIMEYWDIDGATATPISLTWDAASSIAGLTASDLSKLTIVGWNGTQWVAIPSAIDAASVLGGASDLNAGSITTSTAIAPNTYTAYTFGSSEEIVTQPAFTCSPASYIITNRNIGGNNVSDIYTLDLSSGTAALAKAPLINGPNAFVNAVGYNTVDNYIWGFRYNTNEIVRIGSDWSVQTFPVTGFPSPVPGFATGDVSPQGILYLYAANSSSITKVDLNQGSANYLTAVTVPTTPTTLNDWSFNPVDGLLYAFGTDKILYRFDPVTGTRTTLGPVTGGGITSQVSSFGTAFFDASGDFFVGNNLSGDIFKISAPLSNLTASLFSNTSESPGDGARCANAIVLDPPVAVSDTASTACTTKIVNVLSNDVAGSGPIVVASVRLLTPGTLEQVTTLTIDDQGQYTVDPATGAVSFTPEQGFNATTSVNYIITDENGLSSIATLSIAVNCPMPVKLVAFDARGENQTVHLTWSTTEEINSDRFEIERSASGTNWNKIGTESSHKESTVLQNYSFVDATPLSGQNLYRLRMVDQDETFAYSSIRSVNFAEQTVLAPYPNPVSDRFLFKNYQQIRQLVIYNANGVKVFGSQGLTSEGIDVTRLQPGVYTITITLFNGTINTHKVAVTR